MYVFVSEIAKDDDEIYLVSIICVDDCIESRTNTTCTDQNVDWVKIIQYSINQLDR